MSKLVDKNGVVHEKGWNGQHRPKQGLFGPVRETDWLGQPKVEKDWLGNPKVERDWLGRPIRSTSGKTLYRGAGSSTGGSSGEDALAGLIMMILVIALAISVAVILILGVPILIAIGKKLFSSTGRKDLGVFLAGLLTLAGLTFLSILAWESIVYGYYGWESILYPALALGCWGGALWVTIQQGWYRTLGSATGSMLAEYWRGVVLMWNWVWSLV